MNLQGKVRGFGKYTPALLEKMKADLGLTLSQSQLAACAAYYRNQEKRDPLIEELRMIDRFVSVCRPYHTVTELLTNDACVARTYADAIAKRRMLRPDSTQPITPEELLHLATQSLHRVGKAPQLRGYTARLQKGLMSLTPAYAIGEATSCRFTELVRAQIPAPTVGDLLVLIRSKELGSAPSAYRDAVSALLVERTVARTIKKCVPVTQGGLLSILLASSSGAQIDLTRLSVTGETLPPSMLVDAYIDECVIAVARQDYNAVAQQADSHGLRLHAFASLTGSARYDFFRNNDAPAFALSSEFLRSMIPTCAHSTALGNEEAHAADTPISHRTVNGTCSKYVMRSPDRQSEAFACNGLLFASASVSPRTQSYRNAIDTALAPILALAASGADYPNTRLALSLTLPTEISDSVMRTALSVILGLYRTEAELGIPAAASQIFYELTDSEVSLSVTAISADGAQLPSRFAAEGNEIYCIAPALDGDAQIDFGALRNMLTYLTSIAKEGAVKSVRLICRETITTALQEMRTDSLTCRVSDPIWACEGDLPLALLIETDREIRARRVGKVVAKEEPTRAPETDLPEHVSLLPTDGCTVTVIAANNDVDGINLAAVLRERGAHALLHTTSDAPDAIARTLLTSDTVILCGDLSLPATDMLAFAARTFEAAGGLVLLLGNATGGIFEGGIPLASGLSEKNLEKICKKRK